MITNNLTLAYLCQDFENAEDYKINETGECFHRDKFIGKISENYLMMF